MNSRIPDTKPSIIDLDGCYATDAAANGWGEYGGAIWGAMG
ncbi:MAG: hypothetical protein VBE63_20885 [Lamprobacter sp.]|nr:hypothetical protein [Lamprobacter sp.]MEA3642375.1 hypothetical protein [Lamprobacter sp.]